MSKPNFIAVPFKVEGSQGVYEYRGIAKFSSAGIVIEYESKLFGLYGDEIKEVRISLDDILDLQFKKGIFRFFSRIHLRLNSVAKLGGLPNNGGRVKFKIKREDWELANMAVAKLRSSRFPELAEHRVEDSPVERQIEGSPVERLIEGDRDQYETNDLNKTRKLDSETK